jgi:hypothetical protein
LDEAAHCETGSNSPHSQPHTEQEAGVPQCNRHHRLGVPPVRQTITALNTLPPIPHPSTDTPPPQMPLTTFTATYSTGSRGAPLQSAPHAGVLPARQVAPAWRYAGSSASESPLSRHVRGSSSKTTAACSSNSSAVADAVFNSHKPPAAAAAAHF